MPDPTPRPWTLQECSQGGKTLVRRVPGEVPWEHPQGYVQIVPAEDADLIVRAVNSHDALEARVAELEGERDRLREVIEEVVDAFETDFPFDSNVRLVVDQIREALTPTKEEPELPHPPHPATIVRILDEGGCSLCSGGPWGPGAVADDLSSAAGGRPYMDCPGCTPTKEEKTDG